MPCVVVVAVGVVVGGARLASSRPGLASCICVLRSCCLLSYSIHSTLREDTYIEGGHRHQPSGSIVGVNRSALLLCCSAAAAAAAWCMHALRTSTTTTGRFDLFFCSRWWQQAAIYFCQTLVGYYSILELDLYSCLFWVADPSSLQSAGAASVGLETCTDCFTTAVLHIWYLVYILLVLYGTAVSYDSHTAVVPRLVLCWWYGVVSSRAVFFISPPSVQNLQAVS